MSARSALASSMRSSSVLIAVLFGRVEVEQLAVVDKSLPRAVVLRLVVRIGVHHVMSLHPTSDTNNTCVVLPNTFQVLGKTPGGVLHLSADDERRASVVLFDGLDTRERLVRPVRVDEKNHRVPVVLARAPRVVVGRRALLAATLGDNLPSTLRVALVGRGHLHDFFSLFLGLRSGDLTA